MQGQSIDEDVNALLRKPVQLGDDVDLDRAGVVEPESQRIVICRRLPSRPLERDSLAGGCRSVNT